MNEAIRLMKWNIENDQIDRVGELDREGALTAEIVTVLQRCLAHHLQGLHL